MKIYTIFILLFCFLIRTVYSFDLPFNGFIEYASGSRIVNTDLFDDDIILNDLRAQIDFSQFAALASFNFKFDIIKDNVSNSTDLNIRSAYINIYSSDLWELRAGHQILTWGTGDLLFVNDLFPKNWEAFFTGKDIEYLKDPMTSIQTSFFTDFGTFDFVFVPTFTPDKFITGERLVYWGGQSLTSDLFDFYLPDNKVRNSEYFFRWSNNISGVEYALYFYNGFYKRPLGFNPIVEKGFFPELAVYGMSIRRPLFGGIFNFESGYYDSLNDPSGKNPFIQNSSINSIIGFQKEIFMDFTAGVQYYSEYMLNWDNYKKSLSSFNMPNLKNQNLDWLTIRLMLNTKNQTLLYSLFSYYSFAEKDWFLMPSINYNMSDELNIALGLNIFTGKNDYTFWGQLEENTNAYLRIKYMY